MLCNSVIFCVIPCNFVILTCQLFFFVVFVFGLARQQALDLSPVKTSLLESSHGCGDICLGYAMSNTKEVLLFWSLLLTFKFNVDMLLLCHKTLKK